MMSSYCGQYLLSAYSLLMIIEVVPECERTEVNRGPLLTAYSKGSKTDDILYRRRDDNYYQRHTECLVSLELKELRVPAYVALGSSVQLTCRWSLGPADVLYSVKWYKDGKEFFRHVPRDLEPQRKFILPGVDVEKSDSSGSRLLLSPVVFETAGRYRCEVSGERPLFPTVTEYADMAVVDLPHHGPVISGLRRKYRISDHIQVNCTSAPSRPACKLQWYINGEQVPTSAVTPPVHKVYGEEKYEKSISLLDFTLKEEHFIKNIVKIKCLATLATVYWQSNEESALLERVKIHERILPSVQKMQSRNDGVFTNHGRFITKSAGNIVVNYPLLLLILFVRLTKV